MIIVIRNGTMKVFFVMVNFHYQDNHEYLHMNDLKSLLAY